MRKLTTLIMAMVLVIAVGCSDKEPPSSVVHVQRYIGQARGFFVSMQDFYSAEDLTTQQAELENMVALAADSKLNTIFFEARQGSSSLYGTKTYELDPSVAFDPLSYLCEVAAASKVQVFAVFNPVLDSLDPTDPAVKKLVAADTAELVKKYDVAGVVLSGLDGAALPADKLTGVPELVRAVSSSAQKADPTVTVGVSFNPFETQNAMTVDAVEQLAAEGAVGMVIPVMNAKVGDKGDNSYLAAMQQWASAQLGLADLYTVNSYYDDNPHELANQLLANAMNGKVSGAVLAPYSFLKQIDSDERESLVSLLAAGKTPYQPTDLTIKQSLAVTYPQNGTSVADKEIWIMGTSDPNKSLTIDGNEVERHGTEGTFGVAMPLEVGENSFVFAQGEQSTTLTVKRTSGTAAAAPINKITTGSLFPTGALGVDSNETIEVTVVGPATASITATLNGETVVMTQATTAATKGVPATFKGSFTLSPNSFSADEVTSIGRVTYVVGYDGGNEVQRSEGEVYVAGKNVPLVVEVAEGRYVASVLTDVSHEDNFTQSLKAGARTNVVSKTRTTRSGNPAVAYKLANGGYVMASNVTVVTDTAKLYSDITDITKQSGDDWEEYTLTGGQPAALADLQEGKLELRLLDTKFTADPATLAGGVITAATAAETKDGTVLTLEFDPGSLWGYDITYADDTTRLYLRRTPKLSQSYAKPLEGIQVMLDPGHGGTDPGAMGVAGEHGPTEAVLNMAYANATKFRLEQLGAEVTLTRADEGARVSLDERTYLAEQQRPHIFLALHHNSTALNKDISDIKRMEAYYWEKIAEPLANSLMEQLGGTLGRDTSDPENAYYYVTRLSFAPAVLFELGYIVNPQQYEDCTTPDSLYRAAEGIAQAVVAALAPRPVQTVESESQSAQS